MQQRNTRISKLIFLTCSYRFLHTNYFFPLALYFFQSTYSICPHETSLMKSILFKNCSCLSFSLLFVLLISETFGILIIQYQFFNFSIFFFKWFSLSLNYFFLKEQVKTNFKTKYHLNQKSRILLPYVRLGNYLGFGNILIGQDFKQPERNCPFEPSPKEICGACFKLSHFLRRQYSELFRATVNIYQLLNDQPKDMTFKLQTKLQKRKYPVL